MSKNKIFIPVIAFTAIIIILIIVFNFSHKYNKISISESNWNIIKESRTENNNLVLEDIRFNDYKLIIDEKNNTLYYSVIKDSKDKFNPDVSYSSNDENVKIAVLKDEITDEKIKNNYIFKIMIYTEKEYHVYNLKCVDLPILNISYNENEKESINNKEIEENKDIKQNNVSMEMYLFDNLSNMPNKITVSMGKIRINEESYILSLQFLTPGKNKRDNKISILNMKPSSRYLLTEASNISDDKNCKVELFLNNEYKGIYYITQIEEERKIIKK